MRRGPLAVPVLVLLALYTAILYARAFAIGVLSDGWVLLEIGSRGFREAPFVLLDYHTIPVTNLLMVVLWKVVGLAEQWYQVVNLAEFVLVGWALYLFGAALFRQPRVGLLASLLFLANSSFYEVPLWPTVGNFQSLAALLYLAALASVHRALGSVRPWPWIALFTLCAGAAFLTYEPTVSVLAVGALYALIAPARPGGAFASVGRWRRAFAVAALSLPVIAIILASKLYALSEGHGAMFLPSSWPDLHLRLHLIVRGCIGIFSLIGADHTLYRILTFNLVPPGGSPLHVAFVSVWALGLVFGAALFTWRTRSLAARFTVLWFALHMLTVGTAIDVVSRHLYLGALPGALLSAWLLWGGADHAAAWLGRRGRLPAPHVSPPRVAIVLVFLVLVLLTWGASIDRGVATTLHVEATRASRQLVALVRQRLAQSPSTTPRIALVNMPATVVQDGVAVFAFVNGLDQMLWLTTGTGDPELFHTYARTGARFAKESRPLTLSELHRRAHDPSSLVLTFDRRTRTVMEANRTTWRLPEKYDAESAPFLEWHRGAWPWFRVYANQPLELPFEVRTEPAWLAIRYLRTPGAAFTVTTGSRPALGIRAPDTATPSWPVVTAPLETASERADVTLSPGSEVWLAGVWSFTPIERYSPETASFLAWESPPFPNLPHFVVTDTIRLPLSASPCAERSCTLRVDYLAERGRNFTLVVEGSPGRTFDFDRLAAPEWRSERVPITPSRGIVVRIEPRGPAALVFRALELEDRVEIAR